MKLTPLITQYFALYLAAHAAHQSITGATFFQDHAFLSELYEAYNDAFDDLAERAIGLGEALNHASIFAEAAVQAKSLTGMKAPAMIFNALMLREAAVRKVLAECCGEATEGTANLLAQLADDSEKRAYKLKQRTS